MNHCIYAMYARVLPLVEVDSESLHYFNFDRHHVKFGSLVQVLLKTLRESPAAPSF